MRTLRGSNFPARRAPARRCQTPECRLLCSAQLASVHSETPCPPSPSEARVSKRPPCTSAREAFPARRGREGSVGWCGTVRVSQFPEKYHSKDERKRLVNVQLLPRLKERWSDEPSPWSLKSSSRGIGTWCESEKSSIVGHFLGCATRWESVAGTTRSRGFVASRFLARKILALRRCAVTLETRPRGRYGAASRASAAREQSTGSSPPAGIHSPMPALLKAVLSLLLTALLISPRLIFCSILVASLAS